MATLALGTLTLSRPRLDLAIAFSPRSSLSVRKDSGLGFAPRFAGLRVSRRLRKPPSAIAAATPRSDRRIMVVCDAQGTATEVPDVTKETWQSLVMECARPVLVEFWAPWCGPCRVMHPVVAKLSKTYEGKLDCFKINTDEFPDLATQFGVRSIPTMVMFKNGEKKESLIGAVPEAQLLSFIDRFLGR